MTTTTPLLRCAHCGIPSIFELSGAERDRGDWILRCPVCDADNVIAVHERTRHRLTVEIAGWRD